MNEYLKIFKERAITGGYYYAKTDAITEDFRLRDILRPTYSFAIPTDEAVQKIVELSPIIEIGAGSGYWAHLIKEAGGDIIAFDKFPPLENDHWKFTKQWFDVQIGGPEKVLEHKDRTLLLVWPPYNIPFAYNCIRDYTGDTLIHVGEVRGCTGDDAFFDYLEEHFGEEEQTIDIPQWIGLHDLMEIYRRRC